MNVLRVCNEDVERRLITIEGRGYSVVVVGNRDNQYTVDFIAKQVGIDETRGDLLPHNKVAAVKALREKHRDGHASTDAAHRKG